MSLTGSLIIAGRNPSVYFEKCVQEFRERGKDAARDYLDSIRGSLFGRIRGYLLEKNIVGDASRYHAARKVLEETI
jgi:hypothetical protein